MARIARRVFSGLPHLVIQQTPPGEVAFRGDADRVDYLSALRESGLFETVTLQAYALLETTVMLIATPSRDRDLGDFMQRVNRRFAPAHQRRHGSRGPIWTGRFRSAALAPEQYLLSGTLMIEQAAVRAGLVTEALDWPWSSARHHGGRGSSPLLAADARWWQLGNTPFEREARYREMLQWPLPTTQITKLEAAASSGWPLGPEAFIAVLEAQAGRALVPRRRGRPRAEESVPV